MKTNLPVSHDLLDDLNGRQVDISSAVNNDITISICECSWVACVRTAMPSLKNDFGYEMMYRIGESIESCRDITLLSDIEINSKAFGHQCGSVPKHVMTDGSGHICFGFSHTFNKSTKSLRRLLSGIVRATMQPVWRTYQYQGIVFWCPETDETYLYYKIARTVLDDGKGIVELMNFLNPGCRFVEYNGGDGHKHLVDINTLDNSSGFGYESWIRPASNAKNVL